MNSGEAQNGVESFWLYSVIVFAMVLLLVCLTSLVYVRWCWPFRRYKSRGLANVVGFFAWVWYLALAATAVGMFFRRTGDNYPLLLVALLICFLAFSPMYFVHVRAQRLADGA